MAFISQCLPLWLRELFSQRGRGKERKGEERCSSQVGLTPEMAGDEAFCLNYLFDSIQVFTSATLFFSPFPTPPYTYTHTHRLCKPSRLFQAALITVAQAVKLSSDD